jgi:hypothetical protein
MLGGPLALNRHSTGIPANAPKNFVFKTIERNRPCEESMGAKCCLRCREKNQYKFFVWKGCFSLSMLFSCVIIEINKKALALKYNLTTHFLKTEHPRVYILSCFTTQVDT